MVPAIEDPASDIWFAPERRSDHALMSFGVARGGYKTANAIQAGRIVYERRGLRLSLQPKTSTML